MPLLDPVEPPRQVCPLSPSKRLSIASPSLARRSSGWGWVLNSSATLLSSLAGMADLLQHLRAGRRRCNRRARTAPRRCGRPRIRRPCPASARRSPRRCRSGCRSCRCRPPAWPAALPPRSTRLALLQYLQVVLADHMADFVRQHARQLGLVVEQFVQALGDEDVAAGRGEGVDVIRFDHAEMPGEIGPFALAGDPASDVVDVFLQLACPSPAARRRAGCPRSAGRSRSPPLRNSRPAPKPCPVSATRSPHSSAPARRSKPCAEARHNANPSPASSLVAVRFIVFLPYWCQADSPSGAPSVCLWRRTSAHPPGW